LIPSCELGDKIIIAEHLAHLVDQLGVDFGSVVLDLLPNLIELETPEDQLLPVGGFESLFK